MKTRVLSVIYFITGFAYLVSEKHNLFVPHEVIKALIIPLLIAVVLFNLRIQENRMHRLMLAGLIFSWAGDIILDIPGDSPGIFVGGLACFLLAHLMYLTVFFITPGKNIIPGRRSYLILPVFLAGILLVGFLYKDLNAMRFPVIMYTTVILTMLAGAINRIDKVGKTSFLLVLAGAILFVISDATIALAKFSHPFPESGIVVMITYITAQYLIVTGYIRQFRTPLQESYFSGKSPL
jgi:uncharacterized membrane protein YhhN